jgi:glycosyltransferase involved in cell wall biosynthesis
MSAAVNVMFIQSQEAFGADSQVHALLMRYLDRESVTVHVACTRGTGATPDSLLAIKEIPDVQLRETQFVPGISQRSLDSVLRSARQGVSFPVDALGLVRYIKKHRIAILHGTEKPRDALYATLLGRLTGAKSVVHVHVKWSDQYSRLARWAVRNADAVFSISRYVTETIASMGISPNRIHTVLNSLDAAGWDPHTDGSSVRREFSIPADAPVLVSVSRLFSWKGQRELVEAMPLVLEESPEARLLIVGGDEPFVHRGSLFVRGDSFTAELRKLAGSLGVDHRVIFTGERNDVAEIMAASDVYTMPSYEEPFGVVFLEAMAMKLPVIGLNNGGTPEVVQRGRAGLLAAPWDVPALAANINTLIADPSLRAEMGEYGRARVLDEFNPERMARQAEDAYRAILGEGKP